jgi:hypothetical protein
MNLTVKKSNTGTDAIDQMLLSITDSPYKMVSDKVDTNNAGLSIIYDESKIGEYVSHKVIDNANQPGRPILMLLTRLKDNLYLSISIHGAQDPRRRLNKDAFNEYMLTNNKVFLEKTVNEFIDDFIKTSNQKIHGIFVMGDFNDRYDAINELVIRGQTLSSTGVAPKSCCHNWDSSCPDDSVEKGTRILTNTKDSKPIYIGDWVKYKDLGENDQFIYQNKIYTKTNLPQNKTFTDDEYVEKFWGENYNTCIEPPKEQIIDNTTNSKLPLSPAERGNIENYKYAGDKVFGISPQSGLAIYKYEERRGKRSTESDHELVFATVGEATTPIAGGKRRSRKTKQRSRKARRMNRKTRKSSRKSKR